MSVKERLKIFIKSQDIQQNAFESSINSSNGYINSISKSIGIDKLNSIIENYPILNIEWLLTGKGEMLRGSEPKQEEKNVFKEKFIELLEEKAKKLEIENKDLKDELQEIKSNKIQTCKTD